VRETRQLRLTDSTSSRERKEKNIVRGRVQGKKERGTGGRREGD
jgi:hypothetical protein